MSGWVGRVVSHSLYDAGSLSAEKRSSGSVVWPPFISVNLNTERTENIDIGKGNDVIMFVGKRGRICVRKATVTHFYYSCIGWDSINYTQSIAYLSLNMLEKLALFSVFVLSSWQRLNSASRPLSPTLTDASTSRHTCTSSTLRPCRLAWHCLMLVTDCTVPPRFT